MDLDFNQLVDRAQVLDSFVQLQSGGNNYRLRSLQSIDPKFLWPNLERVSDDGKLFLNQTVANHTVDLELRLTTDEVDEVGTVTPYTAGNHPTDTKTLSWYLWQKNQRISVFIAVSTVMVAATSAGNKYLRLNYSFELESFGVPRILEEGDVGLPITGRILLTKPSDGTDISPTFIRSAS